MTEDPNCYGSPAQREILKAVAGSPLFQDFFLTGGTCLAVFYLHHRVSHDLDFFTARDLDLTELVAAARAFLQPRSIIAASRHFFSCVVDGVKLDFVVDPLSSREPRPAVSVDQVVVRVDRLDNLGPNKICALVSRAAAKDAVDCYVLYGRSPDRFLEDYRIASQREALLDDLMYAGEKLRLVSEEAPRHLREMAPDLRIAVDARELESFYAGLGDALFRRGVGAAPDQR